MGHPVKIEQTNYDLQDKLLHLYTFGGSLNGRLLIFPYCVTIFLKVRLFLNPGENLKIFQHVSVNFSLSQNIVHNYNLDI